MKAEFWHQRWAEGQIGFHESAVNRHLREHWMQVAGTGPGRVLVPLCGKSLDMLWLAEQGWSVLGVELSQLAVEAFFREWGRQPREQGAAEFRCYGAGPVEILCGDIFHLEPLHLEGVTAVYDRAALVALPRGMRQRYVQHLAGLLPRASQLLVSVDYEQSAMPGPPFAVSEEEIRWLYGRSHRVGLLERQDMLESSPRFRERGLERMEESVYRLTPQDCPSAD